MPSSSWSSSSSPSVAVELAATNSNHQLHGINVAQLKQSYVSSIHQHTHITIMPLIHIIVDYLEFIFGGKITSPPNGTLFPPSIPLSASTTKISSTDSSDAKQSQQSQQHRQEIVVLVGYPACGKTTFTRNNFVGAGYAHVNQDMYKTKEKCVVAAQDAVSRGESVVIDNTNGVRDTRKLYIDIAKAAG
jgi:hypothetical protein